MKTYNIELPAEFRSGNSIPVERATITRERMEEILIDAIEADRKQHNRMLAHEWIRPALGLSEDAPYRFDFYAQEIEGMKADRQRIANAISDRYDNVEAGNVNRDPYLSGMATAYDIAEQIVLGELEK